MAAFQASYCSYQLQPTSSAGERGRRQAHPAGKRALSHYPHQGCSALFKSRPYPASPTSQTPALLVNASLNETRVGGEGNSRVSSSTFTQKAKLATDEDRPSWSGLELFKTLLAQLTKARIDQQHMPQAKGDMSILIGQPFFVPLFKLYLEHGHIFRLNFGPKSFLIISDPAMAKHILKDNTKAYSKGILAEILEFVMGKGLIPADQETWRVRRRAIVPALHLKYVAAMVGLFGRTTEHLCKKLDIAASDNVEVEMESLFSRLTLDVIGKAVFNYDFDSLSYDKGIVEAVYTTLREAEYRSVAIIPYWNIPIIKDISPRQRKVRAALKMINDTLDELIARCKKMIEEEDITFEENYINDKDPSILQFLVASGEQVNNKQLRDDLSTLLIAGHETSAAVLTWAFYLLAKNPSIRAKLQEEVDAVLGDRLPTMEDMKKLKLTKRVINETLRLYPEPPVLIRRSLEEDQLGSYSIKKGEDIFISVWNLHRSPQLWENADEFQPERWPLDGPDPTEVTENYRYLPFGGGPRKCVGDMFATFETITAVAMLVRRFDFDFAEGTPPVGMATGATIHTTDGLRMKVSKRVKPSFSFTEG